MWGEKGSARLRRQLHVINDLRERLREEIAREEESLGTAIASLGEELGAVRKVKEDMG